MRKLCLSILLTVSVAAAAATIPLPSTLPTQETIVSISIADSTPAVPITRADGEKNWKLNVRFLNQHDQIVRYLPISQLEVLVTAEDVGAAMLAEGATLPNYTRYVTRKGVQVPTLELALYRAGLEKVCDLLAITDPAKSAWVEGVLDATFN